MLKHPTLDKLQVFKLTGMVAALNDQMAMPDIDDWGLMELSAEYRRDLLEVLEDRHGNRSTIATSQLPIAEWHEAIGDPTLADAILDRLIHNAYKINMRGESMRKRIGNLTTTTGFV